MKARSATTRNPRRRPGLDGFTLPEVLVAAAMLSMLILLAVPFFRRAQESTAKSSCINNLRSISMSKEMFAIERNLANGARISAKDLNLYLKVPFDTLEEPLEGEYEINEIGVDPTCSLGAPHVLP